MNLEKSKTQINVIDICKRCRWQKVLYVGENKPIEILYGN